MTETVQYIKGKVTARLLAKGKKKSRHVSSLVSISMDLLKTL
jgi:hypothetical protein